MKKRVLGISGKKQSGKDTIAGFLKEIADRPVHRLAFGDEVKLEVAEACGATVEFIEEHKALFRKILQWWGTDFRRKMFGDTYWIDKTRAKINGLPDGVVVVLPDVRFPNEANLIAEMQGNLWRVERPGLPSTDTHASETALDGWTGWDATIVNLRGLEELKVKTEDYYKACFPA